MGRISNGVVKLRWANSDKTLMVLSLPTPITKALKDAGMIGSNFTPEMVTEGILFRYIGSVDEHPLVPDWRS